MPYRIAQVNDRNGLIAMCVIFSIFSAGVVLLRFYARRLKSLRFQADDWLSAASLVFVLALNGLILAGCVQHVITGHSPVVNDWPISTEKEHQAEKYKYGFQTTEKIAFGLIKLSILFLWRRIFGHVRPFNTASWVMIVIVSAWSLTFFLATVFQCGVDWSLNWAPITLFLTQCSNTLDMLTVFTASDILTDILIIAMPIPMIWSLQMSIRRKIAINSMFLVGLFGIGAAIARMYAYLVTSYGMVAHLGFGNFKLITNFKEKQTNPDFIQDFTTFLLWSIIELNVDMICACLPTLLPVARKLPQRQQLSETSKALLAFSWLRGSSRDTKTSYSDSHSTSSFKKLKDATPTRVQGNDSHPRNETTISAAPNDFDLEMQRPTDHNILVRSDIFHRDSHHM